MSAKPGDIIIRDARPEDVPALGTFKEGEAFHRDRIGQADGATIRYLVAEVEGRVAGYGMLVLRQPPKWNYRMLHLPELVDLFVSPDARSRGIGRTLLQRAEEVAREAGLAEMWLGVDPENNPRAMDLYRRLGYVAVDKKPVEDRWEYTDSAGIRHAGLEWIIYMRKRLGTRAGGEGTPQVS